MTGTLQVQVARKTQEAEDICGFELVALPGQQLPPYTAGAHIDVPVPGGQVRQYSLCGDPAVPGSYRIAVLREANGRGGSRAMHDQVQAGDQLAIGAPKNHFGLHADAAPSLLLAGGIGITPLLAMALTLARAQRPFALHYCTRNAARTALREALASPALDGKVHLHHDDGPAAQRFDLPATLAQAPAGAHLYVCGPAGFIQAVLDRARAIGWPEERLHREFFAAPVAAEAAGTQSAFEVVIHSTGQVVPVGPDTTVVAALAAVGIEVMTSCEQGVCGTCVTRVREGVPDHRDAFFTPQEQAAGDQFTPCCSRALSARLVLDL
jgi:vanillate O-demethylase ferredoxin subunit